MAQYYEQGQHLGEGQSSFQDRGRLGPYIPAGAYDFLEEQFKIHGGSGRVVLPDPKDPRITFILQQQPNYDNRGGSCMVFGIIQRGDNNLFSVSQIRVTDRNGFDGGGAADLDLSAQSVQITQSSLDLGKYLHDLGMPHRQK